VIAPSPVIPELSFPVLNGVPAVSGSPIASTTLSTAVIFTVLAGGAVLAWRAYARRLALGMGAGAVLPAMTLSQHITPPVALVAAGVVGVVVWHRWSRTASTVTRWGARSRRKSGVASSLDIARNASPRVMRARAGTVRPSLTELSWGARRRLPVVEVAALLCRVGAQTVWSSIENVIVVFGGPRMGKSTWLVGRIIDAPGAALVTSTRTDLHADTAALRAKRGPVFVFNPTGLGGPEFASTVGFDPLTGCCDPVAASERAADMIAAAGQLGAGGADRAYWDGQARRVLAALLHAAALGGRSMRDVAGWVADPDRAEAQLSQLLKQSPEPAFVADAAQFVATNDRTRTSITSSIMPALAWLTHPAAVAAAPGGQPLDIEWLLARRGTVYLLGGEEAALAPLVCALTGYVAREARRIAAEHPGGRLDPPLTLALDEAALICPIPLDRWSADMGGRGVMIIACFQSRAQLIDRYGAARAATILNNAASKVLFGGTSDKDDLAFWSTLAGERDEPVTTTDLHGRVASRTVRKVPVLAPAQLAQLPKHKVVVFASGMPPVVGRAEKAWTRADVRAVQRPNSLRVRGRVLAARLVAVMAGWVTRPGRAAARFAARVRSRTAAACVAWLRAQTAAATRLVARLRAQLAGWRTRQNTEPTTEHTTARPVGTEPAGGRGGAEVVPFPATEWPTTGVDAEPAAFPAGDWPHDNGNGDGVSGRWN
jgi:type IV secretory pathway TraG/TraD family ATPase VirD4